MVGEGEVQGTPDTMTVNAAISFLAADATTALNQTSERMGAVNTALVEAGIEQDDIATTNVSLQPQYGPDGVSEPVGYEATNSIDVTVRDTAVAGRVLALIQSSGGDATRINSMNFSIDDDSELVKGARARAFEDAQARAQQYAELSGMELGKIISISRPAAPPRRRPRCRWNAPWPPARCRCHPASRPCRSRCRRSGNCANRLQRSAPAVR